MANLLVVDPVTRLEGHLRVEVGVETVGGVQQVVEARLAGTSFRGFERLLEGRAPAEAAHLTQRICGVCSVPHGVVASMALEATGGAQIPTNARILRNFVLAANFLQSHILHFYHLSLLDFAAGPDSPPWTPAWKADLRIGPEDSARLIEHYKQALGIVRQVNEMAAIFAGRQPHSPAFIAGGFTQIPTREAIEQAKVYVKAIAEFVRSLYIPDVDFVANQYPEYGKLGRGTGNFMSFGVFDLGDRTSLFGPGRISDGSTEIQPVDPQAIRETVVRSWFEDSAPNRHPSEGVTQAAYPKEGAYSWLKAPRYDGRPYETGPLARMWIAGRYRTGISVNDRHKARARESLILAEALSGWLAGLEVGGTAYTAYTPPVDGTGAALTEAPRGALGHWLRITGGKIAHYQIITPTCWNASPRDDANQPGPIEQALVGTPVQDREHPVEVLRVVHAFDPCLACAVHALRI
ncbi:MAG: nickel-dependent hydrogenase large subunit [Phycisphaerae bacterium]|nr:nickel-dependent hydrogenase large subunit [Phycisphaerae bacterium]